MEEKEAWKVVVRLPVMRMVIDEWSAPYYRLEPYIYIDARCPKGHELPRGPVDVKESAVRAFGGKGGPKIGCGPCGLNYHLPLGEWPEPFPVG